MALFQRAACVPSSCRPIDVEKMLNKTLQKVGGYLGLKAYAEVFEENCYVKQSKQWSNEEIIFV